MKNNHLFLFFLLLPILTSAQHFEVGLAAGLSNYQGDLGPAEVQKMIKESHAAYGGFARYNFNDYLAAKANVFFGTISGDDANSDRTRGLSFQSNILEFGLTAEFNILGYQPYNLQRTFSPYIFAGVSYFRFDPQTQYSGEWVRLQPLGTEGQGLAGFPEKYKLGDVAIPAGLGIKYAINDMWNVGLEFGARKTFNDYLDDVGGTYADPDLLQSGNGELAAILANRSGAPVQAGDPRGDNASSDWFYFGVLTISYNFLDNGLVGSRGRSRKKSGCPTF